ncbi:hypothetical protein GCM10027341_50830 [Spirosoma knui]
MNAFTTLRIGALAALILSGASACKKDQDNASPSPASAPAFVGKSWTMTAYTLDTPIDFDGDGTLDNDLTTFLDECHTDDSVVFEANGKVMGNNGQQRCEADEQAVEQTNTWSFDVSTQVLTLKDVGNPARVSQWHVLINDGKTLKASVEVNEDGVTMKATLVLKN